MKIQILIDNKNSWIVPYAEKFTRSIIDRGHQAEILHQHWDVTSGDILILLSCEKKFTQLGKNKHNLVVHESALPQGKGWSPVTWQVLKGKNSIPITLIEASEDIDGGPIYLQGSMELEGHELIEEIRAVQASKTIELILTFIDHYSEMKSIQQQGESSYFKRRGPAESELDLEKTLGEQFNLLRVCDNERYPAFFMKNGIKYVMKIDKSR